MTVARRNGKWLGPRLALCALVFCLAAALMAPAPLTAQTTERIVVDRHTGLAINGYDPVGYFTDAKPMPGRDELEYLFAGAVWRFRNEGNRAAFIDRPEVYMPRFGGYDPTSVARGVATEGHPLIWLIAGTRLYLFHSAEERAAFAADESAAIAAAEARWHSVERELVN